MKQRVMKQETYVVALQGLCSGKRKLLHSQSAQDNGFFRERIA
jgi:hypothetical protein